MEKAVLPAPQVQKLLRQLEEAALYTDANTDEERANQATQIEKFGGAVIPAYYVVDPASGKVLSEQVGACSVDEFVAFLERGLAALQPR